MSDGLPADGVVTAIGKIGGQTVCVMANDSTVKAGSWGAKTVEKIIRIQEIAEKLNCPLIYLVDSAGARITDQINVFPGDAVQEEFLQSSQIIGTHSANLSAFRTICGRRRLYSGLL